MCRIINQIYTHIYIIYQNICNIFLCSGTPYSIRGKLDAAHECAHTLFVHLLHTLYRLEFIERFITAACDNPHYLMIIFRILYISPRAALLLENVNLLLLHLFMSGAYRSDYAKIPHVVSSHVTLLKCRRALDDRTK